MRIRHLPALLCLIVAAGCPGISGDTAPPKMLDLIAALDAPEYAESVPWPEHIALIYRLAQDRPPSETEYHTLATWAREGTIRRSDALSFALANGAQAPSFAQCAAFARGVDIEDFTPSPADRAVATDLAARDTEVFAKSMVEEQAKRLSALPPSGDAPAPQPKAGEAYTVYFGNLHAHSALSDGRGTPEEAYEFARYEGGLDFFALTDHGELLILWPWDNKWQRLLDAADAADDPGAFAALYGFEWSNPVLGHINVLNTRQFTHALENFWLGTMYDWVASRPGAVAHFNHPDDDGASTLGIDFLFLMPWPRARDAFVGIEIINGNSGLDQFFYDTAWYSDLTYLDVGNQNGWHLGPFASQDNHRQDWGTMNQARTAVLATELTRDAITAALRARRFYATEDKNLRLDFRCQGYPMGTGLTGGERVFTVTASDDDGDRFERLRLVRNGRVIEDRPLGGVQVVAEAMTDTATGPAWYYVILTQTDDNDGDGRNDEAVSSPIRFAR
jgi:hypothetical protein